MQSSLALIISGQVLVCVLRNSLFSTFIDNFTFSLYFIFFSPILMTVQNESKDSKVIIIASAYWPLGTSKKKKLISWEGNVPRHGELELLFEEALRLCVLICKRKQSRW